MINLSLPLSATALREGSEFLAKLSQLAEVIRAEVSPSVDAYEAAQGIFSATAEQPSIQVERGTGETTLADDVDTAEAATVETPEQRQYRLHGNVASAGMEPAAAPLPAVEYETIVIGVKRNPEYVGDLAAYEHQALADVGWTDAALAGAGYLIEVTEQRPLAPAPTVAPSAPALAPSAPPGPATTGAAVEVDADGFPWDERIHSNAAERKAATGKWKTRKNLPAGYKEQIEAELRGASPATPPATSAAPTPAVTATPPAPSVAPAPPAPSAPAPTSGFPAFTGWMMGHIKAGTLDQTKLTLACQKQGLSNAAELSKHPEHCDAVKADLIAAYKLAN